MGLIEVAGYYRHLQDGFRNLGIPALFFQPGVHRFQYQKKPNALCRHLGATHTLYDSLKKRRHKFVRNVLKLYLGLWQCILFAWAALSFDVFIFSYRTSFDGALTGIRKYRDLAILKALRKTIIYVYHGSDARPPYLSGHYQDDAPEKLLRRTQEMLREVAVVERYADAIVNHPPTSQFHNRPVIQWLNVGIPFDAPKDVAASEGDKSENVVRILHAPSAQKAKGTSEVRRAISVLKDEGLPIDYVELIDVPNHKVLEMLQTADLLVDEIYSDTLMAGLSSEAAFYGVPTIVCGLELDRLKAIVPAQTAPPAMTGLPDDLVDNIRTMIVDLEKRKSIGIAAQDFVRREWNPTVVAKRFLRIIQGDIPADWFYDSASDLPFTGGWGMPQSTRSKVLQNYINTLGPQALGWEGKPLLIDALQESIKETTPQSSEMTV